MNLRTIYYFSNLDESCYQNLLQHTHIKHFKKGEIIHLEEDLCAYLEIVKSGKVVIGANTSEGEFYTVKLLGENQFITPNNLFAQNQRYFVHIEALEDVELYRISKNHVVNELANQSFRHAFLQLLSDTGRMMGNQFISERKLSLRDKIIIYIKHLYQTQQSTQITLPITKTLLANHFGVARTSLSRELQKMEQEQL
ncbi:MAG: Crp/Fnr family transcriptional regulator, partial [Bacilli bacterium]|nr:Crp/Fnr family transcriptional regulator [Bacilli bacterium]